MKTAEIVLQENVTSVTWAITYFSESELRKPALRRVISSKGGFVTPDAAEEWAKTNRVEIQTLYKERKKPTQEAINPNNRMDDIPTTTTYMLYKNTGNTWTPVARYQSEAEARQVGQEMMQELGGKFKVKKIQYPVTKYE
jgi:hypothetical protein